MNKRVRGFEDFILSHFNSDIKGEFVIDMGMPKIIDLNDAKRIDTSYMVNCNDSLVGVYNHSRIHSKKRIVEFGYMDLQESSFGSRRPSWDEFLLIKAMVNTKRSSCVNVHAGACIVDSESHVELGNGYNGAAPGLDNCLEVGCRKAATGETYGERHGTGNCWGTHAEQNAASHITRLMDTPFNLYTTIFTCNDCANNLLAYRGFDRLVFKVSYDRKSDEIPLTKYFERGVKVCRLDLSPERYISILLNEPEVKISVWRDEQKERMKDYLDKINLQPTNQKSESD